MAAAVQSALASGRKLTTAQRTALLTQQRSLRLLDRQRALRQRLEETQVRLNVLRDVEYRRVQVRQSFSVPLVPLA